MRSDFEPVLQPVVHELKKIRCLKERVLVAIDGRCAAGKTTLANCMASEIGCNVFHTDDYFPRFESQKSARDGSNCNLDYQRFEDEILHPVQNGQSEIRYCPYDCHKQILLPPVSLKTTAVTIVEGSYSCHPIFGDVYDLRIFLSVDPDEQARRILARNRKEAHVFLNTWIPAEERYFSECHIRESCDYVFET